MVGRAGAGIKTRKVAILVEDGVDFPSFKRVQHDLADAGAVCKLVGVQLGAVSTLGGRQLVVECTLANMPSVMFDAVLIPGGAEAVATLCGLGDAVHFVLEAYKHGKAICAINDGAQLLATLGFSPGRSSEVTTIPTPGVLLADAKRSGEGQLSQEFIAAIALHRHWERVNLDAIPA